MPETIIDTLVSIIQKATGLTIGQAKTCIHYAAITYSLDDLDFCDIVIERGRKPWKLQRETLSLP